MTIHNRQDIMKQDVNRQPSISQEEGLTSVNQEETMPNRKPVLGIGMPSSQTCNLQNPDKTHCFFGSHYAYDVL